jgi:hypothetical protein
MGRHRDTRDTRDTRGTRDTGKSKEVRQDRFSSSEGNYLDATQRPEAVKPKKIRRWRDSQSGQGGSSTGKPSLEQIERDINRLRLRDVTDSSIISKTEETFQEYFASKKVFKTDIGRILPCEDMLDAHIRNNGGNDHSDELKKEIIQGYLKRSKTERTRDLIPSNKDNKKWEEDLHEKYDSSVKVLSYPDVRYNCHTYALTFREGQRSPDSNESQWIPNHYVRTIIADQRYSLVATNRNFSKETVRNIAANPQSYFILHGEDADHSGRFATNKEGKLLVDKRGNPMIDSKWGAEGIVRHTMSVGEREYGATWEIYDTGRPEGPHLQEGTESF